MSQTTLISEPVVSLPLPACCSICLFFPFSSCPHKEAVNIGLKLLFAGDLQATEPESSQNRYSLALNFNLFLPVVFFQSAHKVTCSGCSLSPSTCVLAPPFFLFGLFVFFQAFLYSPLYNVMHVGRRPHEEAFLPNNVV